LHKLAAGNLAGGQKHRAKDAGTRRVSRRRR
jgi:hypothetical protein